MDPIPSFSLHYGNEKKILRDEALKLFTKVRFNYHFEFISFCLQRHLFLSKISLIVYILFKITLLILNKKNSIINKK